MDIETLLHVKNMIDQNEDTFFERFNKLIADNENAIDEFKDKSNFDFNIVENEDGKE